MVLDSSWSEELAPSPIEVETVVINDLSPAGDRVAFHACRTGPYLSGLPGIEASSRAASARLDGAGFARVADGRVQSVRVVTDRMGTARVMLHGA